MAKLASMTACLLTTGYVKEKEEVRYIWAMGPVVQLLMSGYLLSKYIIVCDILMSLLV